MSGLRTSLQTTGFLSSLAFALILPESAYAECVPQTEQVFYYRESNSNGIGYHDMSIHSAPDPACPVDYYSTEFQDQYEIGSVMPTFHISPQDSAIPDSIIHLGYGIDANFAAYDAIKTITVTAAPNPPFNIHITSGDGYQDLNSKIGNSWNVNDAVINWHAGGGDDRLEAGDNNVDIMYGGNGNDYLRIFNQEDKAIEYDDEGFDVVCLGPEVRNYKFDYMTSIEAVYLSPGASVDMNYLPPNVVMLDYLIQNTGAPGGNIVDYLNGSMGNDALLGSRGPDDIKAGGGNDYAYGGAGNDIISGGTGDDIVFSESGNDAVDAGEGNDTIIGGSGEGNDTYNGGNGIDTVKYTSAKDGIIVNLLAKINQAYSIAPGDSARIGVDQIALVENVVAGNFNDQVIGNKLANTLEGEGGNDLLRGEKGNDTLIGGRGSDTLIGGSGNEAFVYRDILDSEPSAPDTITDFSVGKEKIHLSQIDASTILDGNNAFMFNGASPIGTSSEGEISIVRVDNPGKSNDYMMIYLDTDADPDPEAAIRVNKLLKLSLKNFVL